MCEPEQTVISDEQQRKETAAADQCSQHPLSRSRSEGRVRLKLCCEDFSCLL